MVSLSLVALTLMGALSIRSEPATLPSTEATAKVTFTLTGPDGRAVEGARFELTSTVGSLGPVQSLGKGVYEATYSPPSSRYPQVALIRVAQVGTEGAGGERAWLSLPMSGFQNLKLKTKPQARVEVRIGKARGGPANADAKGDVDIPIEVPPGFPFAEVRSVDRLGNVRIRSVALDPPPFAKIAFANAPAIGAGVEDASPMRLEAFVIRPDGEPLPQASAVTFSASTGALQTRFVGAGVFEFDYRAPEQFPEPQASVSGRLAREDAAQNVRVEFPLRGGEAVSGTMRLDPSELKADGPLQARLVSELKDAKGNPADVTRLRWSADVGEVKREGLELSFVVPAAFGDKRKATVTANGSGDGAWTAEAMLTPGAPVRAAFGAGALRWRIGEENVAEVRVVDAFGNPVGNVPLAASLASMRGPGLEVRAGEGNAYSVRASLPENHPTGGDRLVLRLGDNPEPLASEDVVVLPSRAAGQISLGALFLAQTNLGNARAGGVLLTGNYRPFVLPLELMVQVGGTGYQTRREATGFDDSFTLEGKARALNAAAGLRLMLDVTGRFSWHVSGVVGVQRTQSDVTLSGPDLEPYSEAQTRTSPLFRGATGVSSALGPGRLLAEIQLSHTAPGGQLGDGNIGGVAVAIGYEFRLR